MRHDALTRAIERVEGRDVLVAFSGGKESWVVLDLCKQHARRVEAFTMELVPGLVVFDAPIVSAEARYGLRVRRYPHWLRSRFRAGGVYCFERAVPELALNDVFDLARADSGIPTIVTGTKKADSAWRASRKKELDAEFRAAPLWDWGTRDVLAYLSSRKIPRPPSDGRRTTGIDLTAECVCWLHDLHQGDYERLQKAFPFVEAIVQRRDFYGAGPRFDGGSIASAA